MPPTSPICSGSTSVSIPARSDGGRLPFGHEGERRSAARSIHWGKHEAYPLKALYEEMALNRLSLPLAHSELMRLEHRERPPLVPGDLVHQPDDRRRTRQFLRSLRCGRNATGGSTARLPVPGADRRNHQRRFVRVKGLQRELKHESFREGGVNDFEHKLVTQVSYPSVVLERGLALDDLWKWAQAAADGDIQRKTILDPPCRTRRTRRPGPGSSTGRCRSNGPAPTSTPMPRR